MSYLLLFLQLNLTTDAYEKSWTRCVENSAFCHLNLLAT